MTPVALGPLDFPVLLAAVEILKTRFAQTVQNFYPTSAAVLGNCQWENILCP